MPLVILRPLAVDIFLPALPTMANSLMVTPTQIQWTITVFMFSLGFGQLVLGPVSDNIGRKPTLLLGIVVYLVTSLVVAFTQDFIIHLMLRGLQGIGACAIMVASFAAVTDKYDEKESAKIYSYLHGIIFCVPALAPTLGYKLTMNFGWASNFFFMTGIALVILMTTWMLFNETKLSLNSSLKLPAIHNYLAILVSPNFALHSGFVMFAMATIMAFVSTAPNLFVLEFGLPEHVFTYWFSINAAVTIIGSFAVPKLLSRFPVDQLIITGILLALSSALILSFFYNKEDVLSYMLPVILGTVGFSLMMGTSIGKALSAFKEQAGLATALIGFIQMSGSALLVTGVQAIGVSPAQQVIGFSACFLPLLLLKLRQLKQVQERLSVTG